MQVSSYMTDFMNFKDEIYKKVRLLESKLMSEINTKFGKLNTDYQKLDNKLTFINENTDSLLEFIATQKSNSDKIVDLELFKNKAEQNIISHDMKIKNLSAEIEKIKTRYDKLFHENLDVPGYIGPGCQFKTISEYIQNYILEFSILKNEKEKIKIENVEVKNKLDNILKSTLNLIDSSIIRSQHYSDNKHEDMKNILNIKMTEVNEKNMDLRTQINKIEMQNEKQIENVKNDIENLLLMKNKIINLTEQKIEEINNKVEIINEEINILKTEKKENENTNTKKKKNDNSNNNIYVNNLKKSSNYKLQKMIPIMPNNNNLDQTKNQINYISELKRLNKNKEEKKLNGSEEDYSSKNFEKIIPNNLRKIDEYYNLKEKLNEENKDREDKNILNNISQYFKNKNINENINEKKEMNITTPIIQQTNKYENTNINNINNNIKNNFNDNINNINNNYNNQIYKDSDDFYRKKKKIINEKIKIESLEKQKFIHSNSSQNINTNKNIKLEKEKENDNIINTKNTKNDIENFSKINIKKRINKDNNKISNTPRIINIYDKNKKNNYIIHRNTNEQNKIIQEIKAFYNNKKEKNEQKSQKNIVDCNIINLHLEKPLNEKHINASAKTLNHSQDTINRNNLSEIRMKVNPVFGRTTYSFYNKGEINNNYNNNEFEKNKNRLKDKLNIAFVSSINKKINLNEKCINSH